MVILDIKLDGIYCFKDFQLNFTYPKKLVNSLIGEECLANRPNFRYKKAIILMGANATGKTSLGKALLRIFAYINTGNQDKLFEMVKMNGRGSFALKFVNDGATLHKIQTVINSNTETVELKYSCCGIDKRDTYEKCSAKLRDKPCRETDSVDEMRALVGKLAYRFAYPYIEPALKFSGLKKDVLLPCLRAVIGTLDSSLKTIVAAKELKDSYIIKRNAEEIIIQDGKLLNRESLSSGTCEGIDVAVILASIIAGQESFYYCDEHFSYIHSEIEKRIFGIMLDNLGNNEQLIFTTHNMDMLDLNLPKHSYAFLRKECLDDSYVVKAVYASDILKRNTDSVRCAVENDVFLSLPDDSLLDAFERGLHHGK